MRKTRSFSFRRVCRVTLASGGFALVSLAPDALLAAIGESVERAGQQVAARAKPIPAIILAQASDLAESDTPDPTGVMTTIQDWLSRANRDYQGIIVKELSEPSSGQTPEDAIARKLDEQQAEEARKTAEERAAADRAAEAADAQRLEEDRQRAAETRRLADEAKQKADEIAKALSEAQPEPDPEAEAAANAASDAARAERQRREAEKLAEESRRQQEAEQDRERARAEEEERRAAEARRVAEAQSAEEDRRAEEERRTAAAARRAEEERRSAEAEAETEAADARHSRRTVRLRTEPIRSRGTDERSRNEDRFAEADTSEDFVERRTRGARVYADRRVKRRAAGRHVPARCRNAGRWIKPPARYTVKRGDSLWRISKRFYHKGHRWRRIYRANRRIIANPHLIYPCQRVFVPKWRGRRR